MWTRKGNRSRTNNLAAEFGAPTSLGDFVRKRRCSTTSTAGDGSRILPAYNTGNYVSLIHGEMAS